MPYQNGSASPSTYSESGEFSPDPTPVTITIPAPPANCVNTTVTINGNWSATTPGFNWSGTPSINGFTITSVGLGVAGVIDGTLGGQAYCPSDSSDPVTNGGSGSISFEAPFSCSGETTGIHGFGYYFQENAGTGGTGSFTLNGTPSASCSITGVLVYYEPITPSGWVAADGGILSVSTIWVNYPLAQVESPCTSASIGAGFSIAVCDSVTAITASDSWITITSPDLADLPIFNDNDGNPADEGFTLTATLDDNTSGMTRTGRVTITTEKNGTFTYEIVQFSGPTDSPPPASTAPTGTGVLACTDLDGTAFGTLVTGYNRFNAEMGVTFPEHATYTIKSVEAGFRLWIADDWLDDPGDTTVSVNLYDLSLIVSGLYQVFPNVNSFAPIYPVFTFPAGSLTPGWNVVTATYSVPANHQVTITGSTGDGAFNVGNDVYIFQRGTGAPNYSSLTSICSGIILDWCVINASTTGGDCGHPPCHSAPPGGGALYGTTNAASPTLGHWIAAVAQDGTLQTVVYDQPDVPIQSFQGPIVIDDNTDCTVSKLSYNRETGELGSCYFRSGTGDVYRKFSFDYGASWSPEPADGSNLFGAIYAFREVWCLRSNERVFVYDDGEHMQAAVFDSSRSLVGTFPFDDTVTVAANGVGAFYSDLPQSRIECVFVAQVGSDLVPKVYRSFDNGRSWTDTGIATGLSVCTNPVLVQTDRAQERVLLYSDGSNLQAMVLSPDDTVIGTYPVDDDAPADSTAFDLLYTENPVSMLETVFISSGLLVAYRSFDNGRTWVNVTS